MRLLIATSNIGKLKEFRSLLSKHPKFFPSTDLPAIAGELLIQQPDSPEDFFTFIQNALQKLLTFCKYIEQNEKNLVLPIAQILIDDSGLCVPKLNFRPGVNSAIYAGLPRSDQANRRKLIGDILEIDPTEMLNHDTKIKESDAFFVSTIALLQNPQSGLTQSIFSEIALKIQCISEYFMEKELKVFEKISQRVANGETKGAEIFAVHEDLKISNSEIFISYGFCSGKVKSQEQNLIPGEGHGYDSMFYPSQFPNLSFASISLDQKNDLSHRGEAIRALHEHLKIYQQF